MMAKRFRAILAIAMVTIALGAFATSASAEGPGTPDASHGPIVFDVTYTSTEPVLVAGDPGGGASGASGVVWCRTNGITITAYRLGSRVYTVFSETYFCWNGDELAQQAPRFKQGITFLNAFWTVTDSWANETGGVGDWEHWDYVRWTFQRCPGPSGCLDSIHEWIEKIQRGDGSSTIRRA